MKNSHVYINLLLQLTFLYFYTVYTVQGLHNIRICACRVCYEHSICNKLVITLEFFIEMSSHFFADQQWV